MQWPPLVGGLCKPEVHERRAAGWKKSRDQLCAREREDEAYREPTIFIKIVWGFDSAFIKIVLGFDSDLIKTLLRSDFDVTRIVVGLY